METASMETAINQDPQIPSPQVLLEHHLKLLRLCELELLDRERRAIQRRIRAARFSVLKSLDSFDFLAIPSLNKTLVLELARCEYIALRIHWTQGKRAGAWQLRHGQDAYCLGPGVSRLPAGLSGALYYGSGSGARVDRS